MSEQITLGIDTSDGVSVAILRGVATVAGMREEAKRRHVEVLTPMIKDCLQRAGLTAADVTAVAVGTGPAPYTGLRVGLATARTFAQARAIPVWGVSSLEAIASAALADGEETLVATDARRKEVYWGRYRKQGEQIVTVAGPGVATAADLAEAESELIAAGRVVGQGVALYPSELAPSSAQETRATVTLDAGELARLAIARAEVGIEQPVAALYLRSPDVQMPKARKRAS